MPASNQTVYAMQVRQIWGVYIPRERNVKKSRSIYDKRRANTNDL